MRNLTILMTAAAGAWWMATSCQGWAGGQSASGTIQNPLGALLFPPALLLGAMLGALAGSLLCPIRS
jgi:hypothetical protein